MSTGCRALRGARHDHGAVAVEFALLLPVLLLLVFGIIDFGRMLNAQITITQAAREGARLASLGVPATSVTSGTIAAATGLGLTASNVTVTACPSPGQPGNNATVQVQYAFNFITPIGASIKQSGMTLTATGVMPCET